jgi:hypothetical protein
VSDNNKTSNNMNVPQLNLENFTSSGNLSTDTSLNIYSKTTNYSYYNGLTFVLFYSKPCCKDEIEVFKVLNSKLNQINSTRNIPLKFYIYETSRGTNSAIFSILEHASYRIMGFPYIVTYFNGEFCSVYKPNDLPESNILENELIKYANKISQKSSCKI